MNKTLALVALLGLVSAPAFAGEEKAAAPAAKPAAEKLVKAEDCSKVPAAEKAACEAKEAAAKAAAEKAPAAGSMKKEEKMAPKAN